MQHRKPPTPPGFMQTCFARNTKIQDAIEEIGTKQISENDLRQLLKGFHSDERAYIVYMGRLRKRGPFDQEMYMKALAQTAQVVAMPRTTDIHYDQFAALFQPEILRLLAGWEAPNRCSGSTANTTFTRGLLANLVLTSGTTYVKTAMLNLVKQPDMLDLFGKLEQVVAAYAGRPALPFAVRNYTTVLDQIDDLSLDAGKPDGIARRMMRTNIEIVDALAELHPDAGPPETLIMDGTDFAGWCEQNLNGESEENKTGFKIIEYGSRGKRDITGSGETSNAGRAKAWCGRQLVVLVEPKTGIPVVWTLQNAKRDESEALRELLFLLTELAPHWSVQTIVGDGAWDEAKWVYMLETAYGIHGVFPRSSIRAAAQHLLKKGRSKWKQADKWVGEEAEQCSDLLSGYDGRGVVFCRACGEPLSFVGGTWGDRTGLEPGEKADPAGFRVRFHCSRCGTHPSLPTGVSWTSFAYYPHHTEGMPERYAMRLALQARRNSSEMLNSALKTVANLGLRGANRTRLREYDTVLTLISLALTLRASFLLASERVKRDLFPDEVPANFSRLMPAAPCAAQTGAADVREAAA